MPNQVTLKDSSGNESQLYQCIVCSCYLVSIDFSDRDSVCKQCMNESEKSPDELDREWAERE